jgi:hypothetical protein
MRRQLRRLHHTREDLAYVLPLVPGLARLRPEDPRALSFVASFPEACQGSLQLRPHIHPATRLAGLRAPNSPRTPQGPLDMNLVARDVHVRPLEAQRFAHAHASEGERLKQRDEGGGHPLRSAQESRELLSVEAGLFFDDLFASLKRILQLQFRPQAQRGIPVQQPHFDCPLQHHPQRRVHAPNRIPREARPALRRGLQFSHEDIQNVLGFQKLDAGVPPETGEQMAPQHHLVAFKRRGLHGHFDLRQPHLRKLF